MDMFINAIKSTDTVVLAQCGIFITFLFALFTFFVVINYSFTRKVSKKKSFGWEVKFTFLPRVIGNEVVWFTPVLETTIKGVDGKQHKIYDKSISQISLPKSQRIRIKDDIDEKYVLEVA